MHDLKELENWPALLYGSWAIPALDPTVEVSCSALTLCHGLSLLVLSVVLFLSFARFPSSLLQSSRNWLRAIATPCSSLLSLVLSCDLESTIPRTGHVLTCPPCVLALIFYTLPAVPCLLRHLPSETFLIPGCHCISRLKCSAPWLNLIKRETSAKGMTLVHRKVMSRDS